MPINPCTCPLCNSLKTHIYHTHTQKPFGTRKFWQCDICFLIFLAPEHRLDSIQEKARYDTHQNSPEDERYVNFLKQLTDPLSAKLSANSYGLDFGCGPGPAIEMILQEQGHKIKNYDPFYFPDTAFLKEKYDFITCTETVEHFYNPRNEFLKLKDLLKPKKRFLGVMTQVWDPSLKFEDWWYPKDPTHVCFYQKETLEWIANWLGMNVEFFGKNVMIYS